MGSSACMCINGVPLIPSVSPDSDNTGAFELVGLVSQIHKLISEKTHLH